MMAQKKGLMRMSVMKGMTNDNDDDIMNDERHAARVRDMHALNSASQSFT